MKHNGFVFISYSTGDLEVAKKVCVYLEKNGISCWIAPRDIDAGSNYASQIVSGIKTSEAVILIASQYINNSSHVSNEVGIAFDNKKRIIPFRIEDFAFSDEYLYFLGRKHWINAYENFENSLEILKLTISTLGMDSFVQNSQEQKRIQGRNVRQIISENSAIVQRTPPEVRLTAPIPIVLNRDEIVDVLIESARKYPYSILDRVYDTETYERFKSSAQRMFRCTVDVYYRNKQVKEDTDIVESIVSELSRPGEICIPIKGLPGSAKNMILQLVFYKMLDNFRRGISNKLPLYISASYYEKLPYETGKIQIQMREYIEQEMLQYHQYIQHNSNVEPVLLIDAIREHFSIKVFPENIIYDIWKKYGKFSRVCAVDVGLIKNRTRLKRIIPIVSESRSYSFLTKQIALEDQEIARTLIECVLELYEYEIPAIKVYSILKKLKFQTVDIFLVRLVITEMLALYDYETIRLADIYEKIALSEMMGDEEQLKHLAKSMFEYVFSPAFQDDGLKNNGMLWSLPHKHNTHLEFLIAYHFIHSVESYRDGDNLDFFATILTATANQFIVSFIKDDYNLQASLLSFITDNYVIFNVRQKSNAAYWLGRITYANLGKEAVTMLTKEFTKYKSIVKGNNHFSQDNCDNHFLFRAICTGLLFQGQANMMDEYLCIVVANDVANAINRGAIIEYFGDNYQMVAHEAYYLDTDLSTGEQALKTLMNRIESALYKNTGKFVETNLVSFLTLLQARIQKRKLSPKFDIIPFVKKALGYLDVYQTKPQNIVSSKLVFYFQSVKEDLELYLEDESFDIGSLIYNKYRGLKDIKRKQWVSHNIYDPESVSEHTFSAWLMALFFLPEESMIDGYSKREVLDMLMVHDLAEAMMGDQRTSLSESKKELKEQNDVLRKLFLKGTYPDIANLTYYYNVWTGYYNGLNINAKTARDINLLQTVYTFCEYYCDYPEKFTKDDVRKWMSEKANLKTEMGHQLFELLIINNLDFAQVLSELS